MIFKDLRTNNFVIVRDDLMAKDYLRDNNYRIAKDAEWNEADHPRSPNGQFGSGGGSSKTPKSTTGNQIKKLSSSEAKAWKQKYNENEDKNFHTENVLMEAKLVGSEEDIKEIKAISKRHLQLGHLSHEDYEKRNAISKKLSSKLKEALGE
jgi:hypothetical protein